MNVLGLYDGISAGQEALNRLGINYDKYYASEIDKYAIKVTQNNYPNTIQLGDIYNINYNELPKIDLILGGSPCTHWSIAKKDRETTCDGIGFDLFMQYVKAVEKCKPKYFLYENNYSIHKDIKNAISEKLGVKPIMINSALVSGQQRKREYWTNIPNVTQPKDAGIFLKDILESGITEKNKSFCVDASYYKGGNLKMHIEKSKRTQIFESVIYNRYNQSISKDKSFTIGTNPQCLTAKTGQAVVTPVRIGQIGKGGQGDRIYSVQGKSVCLSANGGGRGAKTGLYKIDLPDGDYTIRKLTPIECERLQTFPDNYTAGISNTQRYKCLGNSWTVDIIAYILKNMEV